MRAKCFRLDHPFTGLDIKPPVKYSFDEARRTVRRAVHLEGRPGWSTEVHVLQDNGTFDDAHAAYDLAWLNTHTGPVYNWRQDRPSLRLGAAGITNNVIHR